MTAEHDEKSLEEILKSIPAAPEPAMASVERILGGLQEQRFYGIVELKFEAGRIVLVRKSETIKLDHYRDNRGGAHGQYT